MSSLEHLIRYESAGSGLAFRKAIYGPDEDARIVMDCLALANADLKDRARYLFLGVEDNVGGERELPGVDKQELVGFERRLGRLLSETVEPELSSSVRGVRVDDRLVGFICLEKCVDTPYLTKRPLSDSLPAGVGFVRRGARNMPLQRGDMQRMFAVNASRQQKVASIHIGFPGTPPLDQISLPVLETRKLPSELASARLRSMLEAKEQARDLYGRTQTRFSRLMHARLYGADTPYESLSDDTLRTQLDSVGQDFGAADDHYRFEVRAHKINLIVVNESDSDIHNARLCLTMPRIDDAGLAARVYLETVDELPSDGYPEITESTRTYTIEAGLGTLFRQYRTQAFREPPRFWAREGAAGKAVPIDYELFADELDRSIKGSLVIYIEPATLKSV